MGAGLPIFRIIQQLTLPGLEEVDGQALGLAVGGGIASDGGSRPLLIANAYVSILLIKP